MVLADGANVKPGAAHNAPTQHGAGFNPADGPAYGLPYPTAAAGRKVSRYRKRTWQRRMKKRVSAAMTKLEGMTG